MDTQLKKGVLELCVLSVLGSHDCYGYELVNLISREIAISEGTIYPLLRRLKAEGYLETYLEESTEGPSRKYYKLTQKGAETYAELKQEWQEFNLKVNNLLKEIR
ncbi:MAG: PadR family transcriptional regulator [Patescibacteria group bacterium]